MSHYSDEGGHYDDGLLGGDRGTTFSQLQLVPDM